MSGLKESPSQTAGPYVHIGCAPQSAGLEQRTMGKQLGTRMILDGAQSDVITVDITVLDGSGDLVKDALIEIWQTGPEGTYEPSDGFANWGRQATDLDTGLARFTTLKPAAIAGQAPHILVWIVARGVNLGLMTRIYFPDEDNKSDPAILLAGNRSDRLVAAQSQTGYAHAIYLQGPKETVFFDV